MNSLKYPHDRFNGYVLLTDGDGQPFIPDWDLKRDNTDRGSEVGDAMKYTGAFLQISKRLGASVRD
jgi:hypothetical protein